MDLYSALQYVLFVAIVTILVKPLGGYMERVFSGQRTVLDRLFLPVERLLYRMIATSAMLGTAVAQKEAAPKPQDGLAVGENEVKQLLLLMDTDDNGKISKQEWMKFMEAEFDRLDKG